MKTRILITILAAGALGACGDDEQPGSPRQPDAGVTPDGAPSEVPLEREHAGGSPTAVKVIGRRAYIGVGPRLAIWDLSTNPPSLVVETEPLRGVISSVATVVPYVYVAERVDLDSQIHVFEMTAPNAIAEIHAFSVAAPGSGSVIHDLEVGLGRLYVADQEQGVVELDLADPAHPAKLQVVPLGGVNRLTVTSERLYYTLVGFIAGSTAGALDIENGLADLGSSPIGNVEGIAFTDTLAIGAGPDGIYVYDVADPANPIERFHRGASGEGPFARAIAVRGAKAYIPADDGLHVLDVADPSAIGHSRPMAVATANVNATSASSMALAIVTDRGHLLAFDLSAAELAPPRITDVTLCADCVGVSVANATIYVADIVGGIRAASLASLADMGRSQPLPVVPNTGGLQFVFEDVDVAGTYAYVADWLYGLRVFDVTSPHGRLAGSLVTGGASSAVRVAGNRAYVAEGTDGGRLRVIDISNPAAPVDLGGIDTSKAMDVEVRGTIAYVADGPGGLRIFDVADPAAITQLALYNDGCLYASDVALLDDLALVACGADGFHWVDISNPSAPAKVAVTEPAHASSAAISVAAWDGHGVLGHDRGVIVINAGAGPETVAAYSTAWPVRAISVPSPGRIVAAAGPGGIYQWKVNGM